MYKSGSKNDIKDLPLNVISDKIDDRNSLLQEEKLDIKRRAISTYNARKIKQYAEMLSQYVVDPEEGSDGIEEGAYESLNLPDPDKAELTAEEKRDCLDEAKKDVITKEIETLSLATKYTWVIPQMIAHFGSWKAVKNEDGLYDPILTGKENIKDPWTKGLWYLALWSRSDLIRGSGVRLYKEGTMNNLVPLILAGFKVYQNIPYSAWDRSGINLFVEPELASAMLYEMPEIPLDVILQIRKAGLTTKTGLKAGTIKDPRTTAMLYGLKENELAIEYGFNNMPKYAVVMATQIWCAHPENRTEHMVLDPKNWDNMPLPLYDSTVLAPLTTQKRTVSQKFTTSDLPW